MSLFSGKCQELSPCAVSVHEHHLSQANTESRACSSTQHLQPNSRKCSNASTAIDMELSERKDDEDSIQPNEHKNEDSNGLGLQNVDHGESGQSNATATSGPFNATRVFKKCASNGSLALYVGTRTLAIDGMHLEPLKGIIVFDKESLKQTVSDGFKIWGQITLTFRYGREDEEVLGLRFCNEAILALKQLWPPLPKDPDYDYDEDDQLTALQLKCERLAWHHVACQSKQIVLPIDVNKCASNGSLALYVGTRTLAIDGMHLEPLKGIIVFDKESLKQTVSDGFKIWGQITLTFRYGREDEEVLGLRFCNEAILALKQLWPPLPKDPDYDYDEDDQLTALQTTLMDRIESSANLPSILSVPFSLCAGPVGIGAFPPPPSVLLAPAKPYRGSPIGTFYDLRVYASERPEERPPRRNTIRLALRAVQAPPNQVTYDLHGAIESRPTILSRGKIHLNCELNKNAVRYGEHLDANITIRNDSRSSIRRILVKLILGGLALCPSLKIPFILLPPLNPDDPDPYPSASQTKKGCSAAGESESPNKNLSSSDHPQVQQTSDSSTISGTTKQDSNSSDITNFGGKVSVKVETDHHPSSSIAGEKETKLPSSSTSSTPTTSIHHHLQQVTLHQHQPQIHHHHIATTPATTPSPVRAPSGSNLFHQQSIP